MTSYEIYDKFYSSDYSAPVFLKRGSEYLNRRELWHFSIVIKKLRFLNFSFSIWTLFYNAEETNFINI